MENRSNIKRIVAVIAVFVIMISGLPAPVVQAEESNSSQSRTSTNQEFVIDGHAIAEQQDNGYYTISAATGFSQATMTEKMRVQKERLRMKISLEASDFGNDMKVGYLGFSSVEPWNVSNMDFTFINDNTTGNMMFKIWHNPWNDILTVCLMNQTETGLDWPAILNVWNFDWEAEHTFGLVKEDGNWYLKIDNQKSFQQDNEKLDSSLWQKFNELCENYARDGAYVRMGSEGSKIVFSQFRKGPEVNVTVPIRAQSTTGSEAPADLKGGGQIIGQVTVEAPQQDPAGWIFKGWYKDSWKGKFLNGQRTYRFKAVEDISLVAVYEAVGQAMVRVKDAGAAESSQAFTKKLGERVVVSAQGEGFTDWTNSFGVIVSRNREYAFTVVSDDTLTANYEEEIVVVWESEFGQVIKRGVYNGATVTEQDMPPVPERLGYKAIGWQLNAAGINTRIGQGETYIINRPVYIINDNAYQITIEGGTLNRAGGKYNENEIVVATANKAPSGMKFSHWEDTRPNKGSNVLSYQREYEFYAVSDFSIRAVYIEERESAKAVGTAQIVQVMRNQENTKTSFVARFSVPDGCQMEFAGIVATQDAGTGLDLKKENADYVRGRSVDVPFYQYTWTKTTGADETWFVRPYLVYRDAVGNVNELYGDLQREKEVIVLTPEEEGAKADGVTDDLLAVYKTIHKARLWYDGYFDDERTVEIRFKEDAAYYLSDVSKVKAYFDNNIALDYGLDLRNLHGLIVKGDNTTIRLDLTRGLKGFVNMDGSDNIQMEGFNFKTAKSVYAIGTVLGLDYDNSNDYYIDIQTDRDMEFEGIYSSATGTEGKGLFQNAFGLPLTDYNRAHLYIKSIEVLDASQWKYRVHLKDEDNVVHKMKSMERDKLKFLVPRPGWGEEEGVGHGAVIVTSTTNLRMENINLWSACGFCFHMRYNDGKILMRNVNVTPEPGTDMAMSGWRDGFHLKNNPGQFVFENCTIERNFDDAFNTGVTALEVTKVYSQSEFEMSCGEYAASGGNYYGRLEVGDRLMIYDENSGAFVTYATVKECVKGGALPHVILDKPIPELMVGLTVSPLDVGQPDMLMKNCYINGTYRFRTPLTCENTEFDTMYAWFDNIVQLEGPVASHQHFTNCKFNRVAAPDSADSFGSPEYMMEIGSVIKNWQNHQGVLKAENIVFENCEIDPNLIQWKGSYDVWVNGVHFYN